MRKIFAIGFVVAMLMGLAACTQTESIQISTTTVEETNSPSSEPARKLHSISFDDYVSWLDNYAKQNEFLGITNLSRSDENSTPGMITYTCDYDEELVSLNMATQDGDITYVFSFISPYTLVEKKICSSLKDAQITAYTLAIEPILGINEEWDHSWHLQRLTDAEEKAGSNYSKLTYTENNWSFSVVMGDAAVSISALNEALSPSESAGNGSLDAIETEETTPVATEPHATQPAAEQHTVACSHEFANATCTTPKTCTKCSATTGSTTDHTWENTSCTTPKACSVCGEELSGSTPGHVWQTVTETAHHDEQGHYGDVEVAKKVKMYRCWLCSYAASTYGTIDAYYAHFESTHTDEANSSFFRERYETVDDWEYVYETQWIVDTPAYSEKIITGYKCSVCGQEKQA